MNLSRILKRGTSRDAVDRPRQTLAESQKRIHRTLAGVGLVFELLRHRESRHLIDALLLRVFLDVGLEPAQEVHPFDRIRPTPCTRISLSRFPFPSPPAWPSPARRPRNAMTARMRHTSSSFLDGNRLISQSDLHASRVDRPDLPPSAPRLHQPRTHDPRPLTCHSLMDECYSLHEPI